MINYLFTLIAQEDGETFTEQVTAFDYGHAMSQFVCNLRECYNHFSDLDPIAFIANLKGGSLEPHMNLWACYSLHNGNMIKMFVIKHASYADQHSFDRARQIDFIMENLSGDDDAEIATLTREQVEKVMQLNLQFQQEKGMLKYDDNRITLEGGGLPCYQNFIDPQEVYLRSELEKQGMLIEDKKLVAILEAEQLSYSLLYDNPHHAIRMTGLDKLDSAVN